MHSNNHERGKKLVRRRTGKSIEEVLVSRKLDGGDPLSWPEPRRFQTLTQSVPNLPTADTQQSAFYNDSLRQPRNVKFDGTATTANQIDDKDQVMEQLMEYCRTLQKKVHDLEGQLHGTVKIMTKEIAKAQAASAEAIANAQRAGGRSSPMLSISTENTRRMSVSPHHRTRSESINLDRGTSPHATRSKLAIDLKSNMSTIDLKVLHLKELFRKGDPLEERRRAASKITCVVRSFLARRRLCHYQQGLREWKWSRCRVAVWLMDLLLANQSKLDAGFHQMKLQREMKCLNVVLGKWHQVVKQNAPLRRGVIKKTEEMFAAKRLRFMIIYFSHFKSACVGKQSTKNANRERRQLIDSIRQELSGKLLARGQCGIIPDWEIKQTLRRRVVCAFLEKKRMLVMQGHYNAFVKNVNIFKRQCRTANDMWFHRMAGKCFYAWSDHIYMIGAGLDRKRWPGPRQYEIRYNQKRVDNFARLRLQRVVFAPWKQFITLQLTIRRVFQRQTSRFVRENFLALHQIAKHQRRLRTMTLDNWRSYPRLMTIKPFDAWASFVKAVRNHNSEQARIVNAYVRWKWRQRIILIIKTWRHQAIYGRIDGMYTRQMLIKSLGEQKLMTNILQKTMAAQTLELEECQDLVGKEIEKKKDVEKRLGIAFLDINRFKMIAHHAEQELRRLEAIVESMLKINPAQVEHLKSLQSAFKFKSRNIATLVEDEVAEEEGKKEAVPEEGEEEEDEQENNVLSMFAQIDAAVHDEEGDGTDLLNPSQVTTPRPLDAQDNSSSNSDGLQAVPQLDMPSGMVPGGASVQVTAPGTAPVTVQAAASHQGGESNQSPLASITTSSPSVPSTTANGQPGAGTGMLPPSSAGTGLHASFVSTFAAGDYGFQSMYSVQDTVMIDRVKWVVSRFRNNGNNISKPGTGYTSAPSTAPTTAGGNPPPPLAGDRSAILPQGHQVNTIASRILMRRSSTDGDATAQAAEEAAAALLAEQEEEGEEPAPPTRDMLKLQAEAAARQSRKAAFEAALAAAVGIVTDQYLSVQSLIVSDFNGAGAEYVASRMLLAILDFLDSGDITAFPTEDKREWIKCILRNGGSVPEDIELPPEPMPSASGMMRSPSQRQAIIGSIHGASSANANPLWNTLEASLRPKERTIAAAADVILKNPKSWRNALLALRTLHPGAGNYSGVSVELDPEDAGIYSRIISMRETLSEVMKKQAKKYQRKIEAVDEVEEEDQARTRSLTLKHAQLALLIDQAVEKEIEEQRAAQDREDDEVKEEDDEDEEDEEEAEESAEKDTDTCAEGCDTPAGEKRDEVDDELDDDVVASNIYASNLGLLMEQAQQEEALPFGRNEEYDDEY